MGEPIVQFEHFSFQYHAQAEPTLHDINLTIRKGEKILICASSGSGKSTLAHCINGLIPFSYKGEIQGSLKICGKETRELDLFRISQHVGTVLQDSDGQFIGLTVADDIAFALENDCVEEPGLHERVLQTAKLVDMDRHLTHAPADLSGGQKQRVALAGVIVNDVDLLLFDEPLANLDPATGKYAMELIDSVQKQTGAAVIIIEHRLEDALHRDVDRIILMSEGRILADCPPDELLCSNALEEEGIREPLYITALKYAGVTVREEQNVHSIRTLCLDEEEKTKVRNWAQSCPPPAEEKPRPVLLDVRNLTFTYSNGFTAIRNLSVSVQEGELVAIGGKNGAGKSSFAKVLCGFETQQTGEIWFGGERLDDKSIKQRADLIGYVMQNPNQMISKTMIFDEVALGLRTRSVPEEEIKTRVEEALKICGLWPFRSWPVSALSFGQKKRVTIASILVLKPKMIILDEPTAGQDYRHYTEIMEFLRKLNRLGITVLLITHDMHLLLEYAPRTIVFLDGQIVADDKSSAVLTNRELVEKANLKETSLYDLAGMCEISDRQGFVQAFIDYEKREKRG
ncbi:MAG: ABC transporter ATP-binding protein [Oscillospiraceae bacterium]|nr:ABC transporter ATP-binding protein [Oscillospiraceae bacterium]